MNDLRITILARRCRAVSYSLPRDGEVAFIRWAHAAMSKDLKLRLFVGTCFVVGALMLANSPILADTLTTPSFKITITEKCEDGEVPCDNVSYLGVSRKTGKTIQLKGKTLMHYCPDDQGDGPGKTPCHHQGYEFHNGAVTYLVLNDGRLIVDRGKTRLFEETGDWAAD